MENQPKMRIPPIPVEAICAKCGSSDLSAVPKFCAGSGTAYAPFNEGSLCCKCGYMGAYALEEGGSSAK